jgi:hypothetical protein
MTTEHPLPGPDHEHDVGRGHTDVPAVDSTREVLARDGIATQLPDLSMLGITRPRIKDLNVWFTLRHTPHELLIGKPGRGWGYPVETAAAFAADIRILISKGQGAAHLRTNTDRPSISSLQLVQHDPMILEAIASARDAGLVVEIKPGTNGRDVTVLIHSRGAEPHADAGSS